ncbi:DUF1320 domain-containing protein [Desulfovibrio piger]|uniref:DUF1320 domain-containing protein n=2 Tax=Desulfovibrio TaxID=872 RepID=UPI0026EBBCEE|nr:DUF1320 domain-containing protein [Desulfovibrio piger]
MATYATAQDILNRYATVAVFLARLNDEGLPDTAPLETALHEATSEIDAALRGRYRLPVTDVPPVLRRIAVDLAVDAIPRNGIEAADLFERRAKAARQLLAEIAAGKAKLDLPEADTTDSGSSGGVRFWSPLSRFRKMLERM